MRSDVRQAQMLRKWNQKVAGSSRVEDIFWAFELDERHFSSVAYEINIWGSNICTVAYENNIWVLVVYRGNFDHQ